MRKLLFYATMAFTLASALLALVNFSRYKGLILKQASLIEEQRKDSLDLEEDFKQLQDKVSATSTTEEADKKELTLAKEAQAKAESELAKTQQQLAEKEEEIAQIKTSSTAKPVEMPQPVGLKAEGTNPSSEKKSSSQETKAKEGKHLEGKILAVNGTWSFVVISLGEQNGVTNNRLFLIKHGDQIIGKAKVTSVEPSTSVADLVPNNGTAKPAVQIGDVVVEAVTE